MQESRQYRSHAKRPGSHWNCPSVRQAELIWMLNNGLDIQKFHIYAKGFSAPWSWPIRGARCHHTPSCGPTLCLWVYRWHAHLQICTDADPGLVPALRLSPKTMMVYKYDSYSYKLGPTPQLPCVQQNKCQLTCVASWHQGKVHFNMSTQTLPHPAGQTRQCVSEQVRLCQLIQNVNKRGNQV